MGCLIHNAIINKVRDKLLLCLMVLTFSMNTKAQDVTFTHFLYNPIYFNPASVGIDQGFLMSLNYRRAMMFIPSKFETYAFGASQSLHDLDLKGLGGIGFFIEKNQEGAGKLSTVSVGLPFSARVPLSEYYTLQLGIAPVLYQKYIDWSRVLLGNQLDPFYGVVPAQSAALPPTTLPSVTFFDFHFGLMLHYESDPTFQSNVKKDAFDIGISVQHLPEPNQSFFEQTSKLPARYIVLARYSKSIGNGLLDDAHLQPVLLYEKQGPMQDFVAGVNLTGNNLNVGSFFRKDDNEILKVTELVVLAGIKFPINNDYFSQLHVNYSFDYSLSAPKVKANATQEISLIFQLPSLFRKKSPCQMYF
ncbi:MAG: PorP/SprF family type IX secretion system membrane protein [Bacteroidota bacterium]|nr:PorP/SprF family type IX secretion system membrane protein [Bacteroidota bacterium]